MTETARPEASPVIEAIVEGIGPQLKICPILKEKNNIGEYDVVEGRVVCRYYSQGTYMGARSNYSRCSAFHNADEFAPACSYSGLQSQKDAANGLDAMSALIQFFRKEKK